MRISWRRARLPGMAFGKALQIVVELDRDTGPITGHVTVGETDREPFTGWLELCGLLEDARRPNLTRTAA